MLFSWRVKFFFLKAAFLATCSITAYIHMFYSFISTIFKDVKCYLTFADYFKEAMNIHHFIFFYFWSDALVGQSHIIVLLIQVISFWFPILITLNNFSWYLNAWTLLYLLLSFFICCIPRDDSIRFSVWYQEYL